MPYPKSKTNRKKKFPFAPGTYVGVHSDIIDAPGYLAGDAYEFHINVDVNGEQVEYKETFHWNADNERTAEFWDYLENNGITDTNQLIGRKEKLTFKKVVTDYGTKLNIVERELI